VGLNGLPEVHGIESCGHNHHSTRDQCGQCGGDQPVDVEQRHHT